MPSKTSLGAVIVVIFIAAAMTPSAIAAASDDACVILTPAQVSAALGVSMGAGSHVTPTVLKTCTWTPSSGPTKDLKFVTFTLQTVVSYEAGKKALEQAISVSKATNDEGAPAPVITPVSGIGDDAFYLDMANILSLIVKKGNGAFKIVIYGGGLPMAQRRSAEKTLADQVLSKL